MSGILDWFVNPVVTPPLRKTLRTDMLRNGGYAPQSESERVLLDLHRGVLVWDDPANGPQGDAIFRASTIRKQATANLVQAATQTTDLQEQVDDVELDSLAQEVMDLSAALGALCGEQSLDRTLSALSQYSEANQLSIRELLEDAWDEIATLTEDNDDDGPMPSMEEWIADQHLRLTEKVRGQLRNMRNRFRAGKQGPQHSINPDIEMRSTTRDHSMAEAMAGLAAEVRAPKLKTLTGTTGTAKPLTGVNATSSRPSDGLSGTSFADGFSKKRARLPGF